MLTAPCVSNAAIMMLIHAGFLAYESGASRVKNVLAAAMKNPRGG